MSLDSDISLLSQIALFRELSAEQLRLLAFSAIHREIRPDDILFREGDVAESGFIVTNGEIVMTRGEGDKKKVLATCEPGCLIGELALFISTKRPATATAGRLSVVMEINRSLVMRMLNEYPQVALRLRSALADRLTATVYELSEIKQAFDRTER
jgi:CRP-like cAMP-binding protein